MILPAAAGPYDVPPHVRVGLYAKYRGIDVDREIQLMALWLEKNKARRPVKPIRFMEKWLEKCKKPNNGASAQPANAHGCRGSQSPACPTPNGPANSDLCPPHTSASSLALAEMAGPPSLKLATGPRPIGEIMGQLRAAIGVKR